MVTTWANQPANSQLGGLWKYRTRKLTWISTKWVPRKICWRVMKGWLKTLVLLNLKCSAMCPNDWKPCPNLHRFDPLIALHSIKLVQTRCPRPSHALSWLTPLAIYWMPLSPVLNLLNSHSCHSLKTVWKHYASQSATELDSQHLVKGLLPIIAKSVILSRLITSLRKLSYHKSKSRTINYI